MIYLKKFNSHASYEEKLNGGGVDISLPNVSYCEDVKDVHYNPYNTVEFYVGEITSPQTVKIYTDKTNHVDVQVSEGNKWYSYLLSKDKGLYKIEGDSVKKVVVKADITTSGDTIISKSTIEASFKGSNTSNVTDMDSVFKGCRSLKSLDVSSFDTSKVTDMGYMFDVCKSLTSLDLSGWNMSNVTNTTDMFYACPNLSTIRMASCNQTTINKIKVVKPSSASIVTE